MPPKKFPPVTVFVTVKNSAGTIKKCIESLLQQDYPSYEVVVVDAYSTDGTYEILKEFADKGKIKLKRLEGYAGRALNWIIDNAKTEIIAVTDADCIAPKHWLKALITPLISDPEAVAAAGPMLNPHDIKGIAKIIGEELEWRFKSFKGRYVLRSPTASFAFYRSVAKKVRFDEGLKVAFETDFCFRLLKYGKIRYTPEAYIYHYHRSTLCSYFKQQKNYAKYAAVVYLRHPSMASGDHISRSTMMTEILLAGLFYFFAALSFFSKFFLLLAASALVALLFVWVKTAMEVRPSSLPTFLLLMAVRVHAWLLGAAEGILFLLRQQFFRHGKPSYVKG